MKSYEVITRVFLFVLVLGLFVFKASADEFVMVDQPDDSRRNGHYFDNRPPLLPNPLIKLPVGSTTPRGWLRRQLELQSEGFHGHLTEISRFLTKEDNAWLAPDGRGENGWEEVPYWLKGFGDCAYLLNKERQIREAKLWIEGALNSQREDGFFGPRNASSTVRSTEGRYDLWPNMVMLDCLRSYYEFTGDERVIRLMRDYFRWELKAPEEDFLPPFWQKQRAADNLWSVNWLYNRTGEAWLLDLAAKIHRHTADWTGGIASWHNVNISQGFGGPAFFYPQSKNTKHLEAAERNYQTVRGRYGRVPGGMFGGDENCRPGYDGPRQAIESCGMAEMMYSHERLLEVTGDPVWADRCEDVAYNSLPAATTADMKALRYLTAPNMPLSDSDSKAPGLQNGGPMLHMNPHYHRCCQHNIGHGWPYFAERLWMATPDNGLAAVFYAASEVRAKIGDRGDEVKIETKTRYPFEEAVWMEISLDRPAEFPLYLRIPDWSGQARLTINGRERAVQTQPSKYLKIQRQWKDGDELEWRLPMKVSLKTWEKNHGSVSVNYGPLTFSLKIKEKYVEKGGTEKWPGWEIYPASPWNYGLTLDRENPASSFRVLRKDWPESDMPFTHKGTPLEIKARGQRIPNWQLDHLGLIGKMQDSPVRSGQPVESIRLIPMGAARLRLAAFPVIGEGPEAREWEAPPQPLPYQASASHCYAGDTVRALKDRRLPKHSNDHSLPRFTWWDRKGTTEWVQYEFEDAKTISRVRVYWFDDTSAGGGCALPDSWRLLYRDSGKWKPATGKAWQKPIGDAFDSVAFPPVKTQALRLEARLQEDRSGGILEWEIE